MDVDHSAINDDVNTPTDPPVPQITDPVTPNRPVRIKRVPLRYISNVTDDSVEGGLLMSVLQGDIELEVELDYDEFPLFAKTIIDSESALINAALTEPIDDPDAKDPKSIHEAKLSIYWTEWLGAIYEELESLKAKGVYEEVNSLPAGRKTVDSKWVLHIRTG